MKLSIIIPCYNEVNTIELIINKIFQSVKLEFQIIIVDDFSTDGSIEKINEIKKKYNLDVILNNKNYGKGYSIRQGILISNGDIILIQDADLEYDPKDYSKIIYPFLKLGADVVYGNRFANNGYQRLHYFLNKVANRIITLITSLITNINFSDVEVGYKAFRSEIFKKIDIKEKSFGFEIEITKKISKIKNIKIFEVPVNYNGRSFNEGKKIGLKDAFVAIYCIFKY